MGTWNDTELTTFQAVERRVGSLELILRASDKGKQRKAVDEAIQTVKDEVTDMLMGELPSIFLNSDLQQRDWISYSTDYLQLYSQLDTLLDRLANPDKLGRYVVYRVIALLYEKGIEEAKLDFSNSEKERESVAYWEAKAKEAWPLALKLLKFDLNNDGIIDDTERLRAKVRNRFFRV